MLFQAGFHTQQQLAYCDVHDLVSKVKFLSIRQASVLKNTAMVSVVAVEGRLIGCAQFHRNAD